LLIIALQLETYDDSEVNAFLVDMNVSVDNTSSKYVLCFYFVFTVFVTVGFGDITAGNTSERIFCIFLFVAGSTLFGTLLSQLNEIMQIITRESRELDLHMLGYQTFLSVYRVPRSVESKITDWARFQFTEELSDSVKRQVLSEGSLPPDLRVSLALSLRHDMFMQLPFLRNIPERIRANFSAELLLKAETRYYAPEAIIAHSSEPANCLMVVQKHAYLLRSAVVFYVFLAEVT